MPADWRENYIPEPNSGCWLWLGGCNKQGYGAAYPYGRKGKQHRAHRLMYECHKGPIPDGALVLHRCDVPLCVNPDHLFLGDYGDNARDMVAKGRNHDQRGFRGNNSRLTPQQIFEIRLSCETNIVLGKRFGVHPSQISRIKTGKRWRW